jgi:ribonuclease HI
MEVVKIYTDGSYSSRTKKAGVGIVIPAHDYELSEAFPYDNHTNQRAELYAVYRSLDVIAANFKPVEVEVLIYTDSKYTIGCLTEWVPNWKRNGWRNAKGQPVLNVDIIKPTLRLMEKYRVSFEHVLGHQGDLHNERADLLARRGSGIA